MYYIGVIQPEDSPVFLESVTMNPLLENTITGKDTYYEKTEDGYKQITVTRTNAKYGYDSSRYTMDIKATTVQATKAAVEHTFTGGFNQEVIRYLADQVADPGVYDASRPGKEADPSTTGEARGLSMYLTAQGPGRRKETGL